MLGHFRAVLQGVARNPGARLSRLPVLTAGERRRLLAEWNDTGTDYPRDASIPDLVREQCRRAPHAIAVEHGDERLT
jgi:non-ribosomal peptide synthetase component F